MGKGFVLLILFAFLIPAAKTDWTEEHVHVRTVYLGTLLGLFLSVLFGSIQGSFLGMSAGLGISWLVGEGYFLAKGEEGLGRGDYDVFAMVGAFVGGVLEWYSVLVIFVLSFLAALPFGLATKRKTLPLVPFIAVATATYCLTSVLTGSHS